MSFDNTDTPKERCVPTSDRGENSRTLRPFTYPHDHLDLFPVKIFPEDVVQSRPDGQGNRIRALSEETDGLNGTIGLLQLRTEKIRGMKYSSAYSNLLDQIGCHCPDLHLVLSIGEEKHLRRERDDHLNVILLHVEDPSLASLSLSFLLTSIRPSLTRTNFGSWLTNRQICTLPILSPTSNCSPLVSQVIAPV